MSGLASHPGRVLLDSNFKPGLLTNTVRDLHEANSTIETEPTALMEAWKSRNCPNVARLIGRLAHESMKGMVQFGSGTIDLDGITSGPPTVEDFLKLQELYIGDPRRNISVIAWFGYLLLGVDRIPKELLPTFDMICGALAAMQEQGAAVRSKSGQSFDEDLPTEPFDAPFEPSSSNETE